MAITPNNATVIKPMINRMVFLLMFSYGRQKNNFPKAQKYTR